MLNESPPSLFSNWKQDLPAAVVVFFVALPLCLGIALASDAPLFSGLIAGIIGGIVVGIASGSHIGVSGPAAGLAAIVSAAIVSLQGYENFLVAVVLGGLIQVGFGLARLGIIGYYFPSSVIKGMLSGIGIIIILKQIPHFLGRDNDPEGDFAFFQIDGENTFTEIINSVGDPTLGPTLIGIVALAILILWNAVLSEKGKFFQIVQGPLVAVLAGVIYFLATRGNPDLVIEEQHLVNVPIPTDMASFLGQFSFPNFAVIGDYRIWISAFTIALVASLETLLCVEATDKLDPLRRVTPTNRELLAQGLGNTLSGLIGGLPVTQVIVRSSANIQSGGRTKLSAITHGFLLVGSVVTIPTLLNMIPLSVLAAILLVVGYKLAKPATFRAMFALGWKQWLPYLVTIVGIVFTDLLIGIGLGLAVGVAVILIKSYQNSHFLHKEAAEGETDNIGMTLAEEVTFFNKGAILKELENIPPGTHLELDVTKTKYLDHDIIEILEDFAIKARNRNIDITLISKRGTVKNPESFLEFFDLKSVSAH